MGFRTFLKGKIDKHGGISGAAKAAADKSSRLLKGEGKPVPAKPVAPKMDFGEMLASLPTEVDSDGYTAVLPSGLLIVGAGRTVESPTGRMVTLFRYEGQVYALDDTCTHEDAPIGEGEVCGSIITCPYHEWEFDFTTGACKTDPDRPLAIFEVAEHDDYIWLGKPLTESSLDRGGMENDGLAMKINKPTRGK